MLSEENLFELIKNHIPKHLTAENQEALIKDLTENFPNSTNAEKFFIHLKDLNFFYQGDGIIDIPFSIINREEKKFDTKYYRAAILSNTCSIADDNKRDYEPFVILAAIFPLYEFIVSLNEKKISPDRIKSLISNVKANRHSNFFFLPEIKDDKDNIILDESIIKLDMCISLPITFLNSAYNKKYLSDGGDRIYSLSNYGFYLFLFKLSVHFCRLREGVFRNN